MTEEEKYLNMGKDFMFSNKTDNYLQEQLCQENFNYDKNKRKFYERDTYDLNKQENTPIKRVFNLLELNPKNQKYSIANSKNSINNKDSDKSLGHSNYFHQKEKITIPNIIEKNKNELINYQYYKNHFNISPINNSNLNCKKSDFLNYTLNNNQFKNTFNNVTEKHIKKSIFDNDTVGNSISEFYRNQLLKNQLINFQKNLFNMEEYSKYNQYSIEKKNNYFKSSIGKNSLNNMNKPPNFNKISKSNFNFGTDSSPLKGSMTIQKVHTSQINKDPNKNILGKTFHNNNNELVEKIKNSSLRSITNPLIFNNFKETIFQKKSLENNKNNIISDIEDKNPLREENKILDNGLNSRGKEKYINNNILNKFVKENENLEFFKEEDQIKSEVEHVNKNDNIKNDFIELRKIISNKEIVNVKKLEKEFLVIKGSSLEAENREEIKKTDEMNYNNKNIKKPSISNYMGFKKNFKKINSEVLNNKKNTVNNFEENKVSDNLIKTENPKLSSIRVNLNKPKKLKQFIGKEKTQENQFLIDFPQNLYNNQNKKSKIIKKMCGRTKIGRYLDGRDKQNNQDSYLIKNKIFGNEDFSLVGVFDGHGPQGHFISNLLKVFLSEFFTRIDIFKQEIKLILFAVNSSMKNFFTDLNKDLDFINNNTIVNNNFNNYTNYDNMKIEETNLSEISNSHSNLTNNTNLSSYEKGALVSKNTSKGNSVNKINTDNNKNNQLSHKNSITDYFFSKLHEENHAIIKHSYSLAELSLTNSTYDMKFSGSTSVCVFILDDKIICGNCGDSRAILVTSDKTQKSGHSIIPLSIDHKPELVEEADRIYKNYGRIEKRIENGIRTGPLRVWLKNENYPGLAMTRSIGDLVASKIGVISEPEIIEFTLNDDCKFIVIASDGIWEIFSNEDVAGIINPYYNNLDVESATEKLIDEAVKKWKKVSINSEF